MVTGPLVAGLIALTAGSALAGTVSGNLPGGANISVAINTPANGALLAPGPVVIAGVASIGVGAPVPSTALVYVLDASGSTDNGAIAGCGGDQNGDGKSNRVMDCELAAAKALNAQAVSLGTVGKVGVVAFATSAATADVAPTAGDQLITGPNSDLNGANGPDIDEVLSSVTSVFGGNGGIGQFTAKSVGIDTNFADALTKTATVLGAVNTTTQPNRIVAFLSDGTATTGGSIAGPLASIPAGVKIFTFAVGAGSTCANTGLNGEGSLDQIATATGAICTPITDVATLPAILPGVIASQLVSLALTVDGNASPIATIVPGLPQKGAASVSYTATTAALDSGAHSLCVKANGTDGGGAGSVQDCHTVTVNAPPVVNAAGAYSGQEGTAVAIAGTVTDPDGPSLSTAWTIAPASGVDPGTACTFANPAAQSTTVKCNDDGVFTLTLTANDSVNTPVSATTTLTLTNVAPTVAIAAPANGANFAKGVVVNFTAPFSDVGTHDTHTCSVDFADGGAAVAGAVAEANGAGTCTTSHAFANLGPHNVLVKVTDDDGGSATAVVKVVTFLPGEAFGLSATGLVNVAKTPLSTCPPNAPDKSAAVLNTLLATANGLNSGCVEDASTGTTTAVASIDRATVLALVNIENIKSTCVAGAGGISRTSTVGTINGMPIGTLSGSINVGLLQVYFNELTTEPGGKLVLNAVRVFKPATVVLGITTVPAQEVILAGCRLG